MNKLKEEGNKGKVLKTSLLFWTDAKKNPGHKQKRNESGHCRSGSTDMRAVDSHQKGEVKV